MSTVALKEIFFAFPDATLTYACESCDQRCCKTGALLVAGHEQERLLAQYPALELAFDATGTGDPASVAIPCTGCWFLDGTMCTIKSPDKPRPHACTLYPFNVFGFAGDTLVVAPQPDCPLQVRPAQGVAHDDIASQLTELGLAGTPPLPLRENLGEILPLEHAILTQCTRALHNQVTAWQAMAFAFEATQRKAAAWKQLDAEVMDASPVEALFAQLLHILAPNRSVSTLQGACNAVLPKALAWQSTLRLFAWDTIATSYQPPRFVALLAYLTLWQAGNPKRSLSAKTILQIAATQSRALDVLQQGGDALSKLAKELPAEPLARHRILGGQAP